MEDNNRTNPEIHQDAENDMQNDINKVLESAAVTGAPKKNWKKEVREWIMAIAVALMVVFFIRGFIFQIILVDGDSMKDTLHDGERLFVTVYDVKFCDVERGDVVICHYPNRRNTNFVKRVVAVPGDTLYCENGVTHVVYETVDESGATVKVDEMLDENYKYYSLIGNYGDYKNFTLGEDQYFVVGDNRYNSHDSRAGDVGPIGKHMIVGHVRSVIWPISTIRSVE